MPIRYVNQQRLEKEDILFEDNHLLVVNKKAGLLVQGDKTGDITLIEIAKEYIREKYNKPGNIFIGLSHRIDRPASGIVILCKTSKSLSRVAQAFKSKSIKKTYSAIVTNRPPFIKDKLVHWLKKNPDINKVTVYASGQEDALKSELDYEILKEREGKYLLGINLVTGRSHQIRAQLSKIKCPIVGDLKYGANQPAPGKIIYLHASSVELVHPVRKETLNIIAPFPNFGLWKLFENDYKMLSHL